MAFTQLNEQMFLNILERETKRNIQEALTEIADKAAEEARAKVMALADGLALKFLSHYSVERYGSDIRITVKKDWL